MTRHTTGNPERFITSPTPANASITPMSQSEWPGRQPPTMHMTTTGGSTSDLGTRATHPQPWEHAEAEADQGRPRE